MKIICYGNCQAGAVSQYLNKLCPNDIIKYYCCFYDNIVNDELDNLYKDLIDVDILITQPINDHYKNNDLLSTTSIINHCNKTATVIMFQSLFFEFYYPDLTYLVKNDEMLRIPIDYHYKHIIASYNASNNNNDAIDNYVNKYNDLNLYSAEYLNNLAINSITESNNRHQNVVNKYGILRKINFIDVTNFIENNYKTQLLFYSMNHPTKYLLIEVMTNICNIIGIDDKLINVNFDPIDNVKCILYKCIQNVVTFNIDENLPLTKNKSTLDELCKLYFDIYSVDVNKKFLL